MLANQHPSHTLRYRCSITCGDKILQASDTWPCLDTNDFQSFREALHFTEYFGFGNLQGVWIQQI
jgi:hypothetical protein